MITLITGAPGAGKTAALVDILAGTDPARLIYASGVPELSLPGRTVQVLDDVATWPDQVPDGALVVIDEVQRVWRPRAAGQAVPRDIAELETHRHRGLDFIIVTQAPGLVHRNVRNLVGRHVHLRDVGLLGRWWYEWPETCDNVLSGWRTAPIKRRYRLPRRVFGLYRSASMHTRPSRSVPVSAIVVLVAGLAAVGIGIAGYRAISQRAAPAQAAPPAAAQAAPAQVAPPATVPAPALAEPARRLIDDRVDWMPRVSDRPESAPAYDDLRRVQAMPVVAGGYCSRRGCRCYTQQATDAGLSSDECRRWVEAPPFDPYTPEFWPSPPPALLVAQQQPQQQAQQQAQQPASGPQPARVRTRGEVLAPDRRTVDVAPPSPGR